MPKTIPGRNSARCAHKTSQRAIPQRWPTTATSAAPIAEGSRGRAEKRSGRAVARRPKACAARYTAAAHARRENAVRAALEGLPNAAARTLDGSSRKKLGCPTTRGAFAARIFRGPGARRRRGRDVDIPWKRIAATPSRIVRGSRSREGGSVAGTYGPGSRRRRGRDVDIPWKRIVAGADRPRGRRAGEGVLEKRGQQMVSARVDSAAGAAWIVRGDDERARVCSRGEVNR